MRVVIVNYSNRKIGGTESYLDALIPALAGRGLELAFLYETSHPRQREEIRIPPGVPSWCIETEGTEAPLQALRSWRPDLIYSHGELDPGYEERLLGLAPSIYFSHNYYGTCVSGQKAFQLPRVEPCNRQFGPACMALYLPRRCGGLNPLTMISLYRLTAHRLEVLRGYDALITHSQRLRQEYLNHGFPPERVYGLKYEVTQKADLEQADPATSGPLPPESWRLTFAGRMERLKGGRTLIEALPRVARGLGRRVVLELAGDGLDRAHWEAAAARVADDPQVGVEFLGWLKGEGFERHIMQSHLLVMPSLWPEPFGKSGLEAGLYGVPSAAFAVGGIPDWLREGVNGHLARGDPPTAEGLAEAIIACLKDVDHYRELCLGARRVAQEFNLKDHIEQLLNVFREVIARAAE